MRLRYNRMSGKRHGYSTGKDGHLRLYAVWRAIRHRCLSPDNKCYKTYGMKGITMYEGWDYYPNFRDWALSHGYQEGLSIDRIKTDGNYEPNNCRWIPLSENLKRRACNHLFMCDGVVYTTSSLCTKLGISYKAFHKRGRKNGFDVEAEKLSEKFGISVRCISLQEVEEQDLMVA